MVTNVLSRVGNTPLVPLDILQDPMVNVFAKLEFCNPTGSVKDRAADYILRRIIEDGTIDKDTTIIESSSGNFGVSLCAYTKLYGLKFICVIDKHTLPSNEMLIRSRSTEVLKIMEPDRNGGYLLKRIDKIKSILAQKSNIYWVNQYENPLNARAYYDSLGEEMCIEAPNGNLDYVFLGVSSGGTITGVSTKVKERYPKAKIVAVDIYGSVVFGHPPKKRFIPGIGSSLRPKIIETAIIDEVIWVSETDTVEACRELLRDHNIYAGGSSGSILVGIRNYFKEKRIKNPVTAMCIMADGGERYRTTIYNDDWYAMLKKESQNKKQYVY